MSDASNKTQPDLSAADTGPINVKGLSKAERGHRPYLPHAIRIFAVPIILGWLFVTVLVNVIVPTLEKVGEAHSAPMTPLDAPSMKAMMRLGHNFHEFDSNSTVMIVLEGQQPLGPDAHKYYDNLIRQLRQDPKHIQHIQDFWGDRLTAAGAQSADAKGAYVQVNLAGNQGTTLANESVDAVRKVIDENKAPPGVKAYVTGPAALSDDMHIIGNASLAKITLFTLGAIAIMLLLVYRSIVTTLVQLFMTFVALACSRGVVAVLAYHNAFGLTTFAANILTMLAIAAGTDYGIFLIGRYQEALAAGEDRESAYYTTFKGVAPVVLGSGLTIAGATYCLSFSRLPWFNTMGAPVAIGMLVVVLAGVTLGPAVVFVGSRFHFFERQAKRGRLWRRVGTAVVRWPAPVLAVSAAVVLVGMIALPSFHTSYNDRHYLPLSAPSNQGQEAANRHFSEARMNPDLLMIESDHDMRNPADMLVLDRVAKNEMRTLGIAMVQDITRPLGIPIQHSSIPFQNSVQSQTTMQNMGFLKERMNDILKMADDLQTQIDTTQRQYEVSMDLANAADDSAKTTAVTSQITDSLRDHIADFDDTFRPIRTYFYWEKHCYDIPVCIGLRSLFDTFDGFDQLAEQFHYLTTDIAHTAKASRDLTALFPTLITTLKTTRGITLTLYQTFKAMIDQMEAMSNTAVVMGQSFDASKNDDFFYLPPEAFDNPDFQTGLRMFLSPDGKSARFFITHQGDPMSPEGIKRVDAERTAAQEGLKQSSLSDARVYLGGTAATFKDMADGEKYDLMIAVVSALTLIFMIMLLLTRSVVAALVIVGTAASSIAASFGLSVLIWQDLFGIRIHWIVAALSVIILLAVGSDYNLLLVSRFREEIHGGLKTGIIRSMAGTGGVVTAAGLVFAFTMAAMLGSELRVLGQFGSTVCIGLLLDTLIVRTLLMPSIATLLGRWFWWPMVVHPRGDNARRPVPAVS
ncbi:MMPL family transporter [Mycobacterium avium subsp. hominissuis]|uniref:MMPL family RND transporter n=1 Tax=Mycobacterium avium subsp. hominissuis TaxID=439334 RepID=A0A2A3LBK8_MYCAV|nr:MMPL family transporter [Mycobacterium avium]APA75330.1 MMPL family transporter [Mycobacterium avium subsp. hominissuis]ETZ41656.1 transport family protein [Mycobacterium avium MAV_120709_2344]MBG0727335.1 MMPL family transporter [Mycobacterium avium]MCA4727869.1 MMPL family transporter [Mycobacterium avium subsp. hominissuis]MCA4734463.1 MMPL family transporter [Mycobacterium avium subsp. hominissuis]